MREREPSCQPSTSTSTRQPYEPPAVLGEETFETLALSCGKLTSSGTPPCEAVPNNS